MRIGFVVNDVDTEDPKYTTTRLRNTAAERGHDTWVIGVAGFGQGPDGSITASARGSDDREATICLQDLDVLFLRNDPAEDATERPWATASPVLFAQIAAERGVLVVNDPNGLARALNKTWFQRFPEEVRPRTLISRDPKAIEAFVKEEGGRAVLKPLQGSGGSGVFFLAPDDSPNLSQITDALLRDGYVVAQEWLEGAEEGDTRVFVLDGEPLQRDGVYAAFRRVNKGNDIRSNMHVGGVAQPVEMTQEMLNLVELARPRLRVDGMFFAGLDVLGDRLIEVNVFSPGGLGSCQQLYGVDFTETVVEALEVKAAERTNAVIPPPPPSQEQGTPPRTG